MTPSDSELGVDKVLVWLRVMLAFRKGEGCVKEIGLDACKKYMNEDGVGIFGFSSLASIEKERCAPFLARDCRTLEHVIVAFV